MAMSHEKFNEELAKLGVKPGGGRITPIGMARDLIAGIMYANGFSRETTDSEAFARGASNNVMDVADVVLRAHGADSRGSWPERLQRALTQTDLPDLITKVGDTFLHGAFEACARPHRLFARRSTSRNLAPQSRAVVSATAPLQSVAEGAPVPRLTMSVESSTYIMRSFSGILGLSRRVLLANDIPLIAELARQQGERAAATEAKAIFELLATNPGNWFSAGNGNSASAASGATVSAATIALARTALRSQIAPDGSLVAARLAYIVCGPACEGPLEAFFADRRLSDGAGDGDAVGLQNPKVLVTEEIVDERLYFFADHRLGKVGVEYTFLGDNGLTVERQPGWDAEGVDLKVSLDMGCGLIDKRAAFRIVVA